MLVKKGATKAITYIKEKLKKKFLDKKLAILVQISPQVV